MQTYQKSIENGIQNISFPVEHMNITQGNNELYSHQGVNAPDLTGYKGGCGPLYAPFDVVYVGVDGPNLGNAVFWQFQNKIRFVDGTIDYATIMIIYDNNLDGIRAGVKYSQGTQIANAGAAGRATGNHNHFETAKGKSTHKYDLNQRTKVYHLPDSISADRCCFVDKTDIINGNNMKWKHL